VAPTTTTTLVEASAPVTTAALGVHYNTTAPRPVTTAPKPVAPPVTAPYVPPVTAPPCPTGIVNVAGAWNGAVYVVTVSNNSTGAVSWTINLSWTVKVFDQFSGKYYEKAVTRSDGGSLAPGASVRSGFDTGTGLVGVTYSWRDGCGNLHG
jgi:hypothetical protein